MHEIALVIIEKIKANLSMSGTFGESIFQSKLPPQAIRGQCSRSVPEVIFALTKRSPRFWVRLNARIGVQRKIPRRSWLLNKNGNKGFELDSLMIT